VNVEGSQIPGTNCSSSISIIARLPITSPIIHYVVAAKNKMKQQKNQW
jgi:hypothetical protein